MKTTCHLLISGGMLLFFRRWFPIAVFLAGLAISGTADADVIILKNGKRITTTTHWIEGGYVKFNIQGLEAGVPRDDVLRIEKQQPSDPTVQNEEVPAPAREQNKKTGVPEPVMEQAVPETTAEKHPPEPTATLPEPPGFPKPGVISAKPGVTPAKPVGISDADTVRQPSTNEKKERIPLSRIIEALPEGRTPTGFRSLYWGMPRNEIPALLFVGTDPALGGINQFVVPDEHLRFGKATVDRIVYGFRTGKLVAITFWVSGSEAYNDLKKEVFEKIGEGYRNADGLERYIWHGGPTDRLLEFDAEKNTGLLWLRGRRQWKSMEP